MVGLYEFDEQPTHLLAFHNLFVKRAHFSKNEPKTWLSQTRRLATINTTLVILENILHFYE